MPALGGDQQGGAPVATHFVHVDAGIEQQSGRRHVTLLRGEQQWRETAVGTGPRIGAGGKECGGRVHMLLRNRPHQCRLPAHRLPAVHPRTVGKEALDGVRAARARTGHEGRDAARKGVVGIRAVGEEHFHQRAAAVGARERERRNPQFVGRVHVGAGRNQHLRHLQVVAVRRPVKRRGAVRLGGVDRRSRFHQRTHGGGILVAGGLDETHPVLCGGGIGADEEKEQEHRAAERPRPRLHHPLGYMNRFRTQAASGCRARRAPPAPAPSDRP